MQIIRYLPHKKTVFVKNLNWLEQLNFTQAQGIRNEIFLFVSKQVSFKGDVILQFQNFFSCGLDQRLCLCAKIIYYYILSSNDTFKITQAEHQ